MTDVSGRHEVPVIAIDGPSGSGKGTICRLLADTLGWHLLDSGALYRVTALAAIRAGVDLSEEVKIASLATELPVVFDDDMDGNERILLAGNDITSDVRSETCGEYASQVAALPAVREALVARQHALRLVEHEHAFQGAHRPFFVQHDPLIFVVHFVPTPLPHRTRRPSRGR